MSAIDEGIVREFFEQNGFFVRQVRKYQVQARKKTGEEEIDLLVYNPSWKPGSRRPDFFLFSNELQYIHRAVVAVKPWHTDVFTPGMLKSTPEIFAFLEKSVVQQVSRLFPVAAPESPEPALGELSASPVDQLTKILVLPALPTAEPYRSQSVQMLKDAGVDGIISFRSLLMDLIDSVETNRSYGKSDTLQVIRLLKNYELLRDSQLDLLGSGPRERRSPRT